MVNNKLQNILQKIKDFTLQNKKALIVLGIIVLVLAAGAGYYYFPKQQSPASGDIILFYGDGCPHCKNVDDFLAQNQIDQKVKFSRLEVFNNEGNQKILLEKVNACRMKTEEVGVPLLWDGKNCLLGDEDIIKFFKSKAGIK